ncbi:hypothetical protein [Flagellimonas lutaonensis]|uniref:Maf-like protein n=1 Tax=Flagellimonas lutaonensis TaxID=516051 RepID=A0A0D5YV13_9FLAO|nr:hypothetical protein [Allomuricauda lutaonensis]AKA36157.1 Maf-like protein [Allomuricauda lutaonensis]
MKKWIRFELFVVLFTLMTVWFESCKEKTETGSKDLASNAEEVDRPSVEIPKKPLSEAFKNYWYDGEAEITSYRLEQARYGELRKGTAVLIFVTEPFLPEVQVKADKSRPDNVSVLKLNATKKYLTGIYPYSIMSSTFYPVSDNQHALKTSFSAQEWCGHVYSQINNRAQFEVTSHSYFEGEADQNLKLPKAVLENELWNKIRIDPMGLPTGDIRVIPSLEYIRMGHKEIKAYEAHGELVEENGMMAYSLHYPKLERTLTIHFTSAFPHTIESWSEEFKSGFGANAQILISKATKIKQLKSPYWRQNSNKYTVLRDTLGL